MRLFVSISIPDEVKESLTDMQKKLKFPNIKIVEPENMHICLRFLGETADKEKVILALKSVLSTVEPFSFNIGGMGVFPHSGYIRVIWAGIEEFPTKLVDDINKAIGSEPDKPFRAHLTLGRVRSSQNKEEIMKIVDENREMKAGEVHVKSIELISSELTPSGPKYTEETSIILGSSS
jgi:RNA 2',3'-cyclic 3'-phosphodiesterase